MQQPRYYAFNHFPYPNQKCQLDGTMVKPKNTISKKAQVLSMQILESIKQAINQQCLQEKQTPHVTHANKKWKTVPSTV